MAEKELKGNPVYLGDRDDRLRTALDQAEVDYDTSKRSCTYDSERKQVVACYMDHVMDIGMMAKTKGDWELVTECNSILDSLQARMYRPKKNRF
tara:strand:+ start:491 stop:772 length:282 start_codon:yes stop_codon:yes gene_type:complete